MMQLIQGCGRIVRAADDIGETFIIDDNIGWFLWKYADFAPQWFKGAFQKRASIPAPPEIQDVDTGI